MDEGEQRQAVAEGTLERLGKREWHQLDLLIAQTGDIHFWAEVLRFELDTGSLLSTGILMEDQVLKSLIEYGVRSMSAFHYAGVCGAERVIRKGLQFRMNVDVGLGDGVTVLHLATFAGRLETVVQLVDEFKANVNAKDSRQRRPLHYACALGHREVVEFLTRRGADIGARDADGATAAYMAKENEHDQIVSFLLESYDDEDDIMLIRVGETLSSTPIYAVPNCRKNVTRSCHNNSLCRVVKRCEPGPPIATKWNDFNGDVMTDSSIKETDRLFQKEELKETQLKQNDRKGLDINYDLHQDINCHLDGVETNELLSQNISETEAGEISEIPMHGYARNNHRNYEKIDLSGGVCSCPELLEKGNEFEQSKAENELDIRLESTPEDRPTSGFHKITNFYEELPEDNGPQLEDVVDEIQQVQSRTSSNEQKTISMASNASSYRKRIVTRTPTYEEIKLPGDSYSLLGEVNTDNASIKPFPHSKILPNQINFSENVYTESEFDEDDTIENLPQILNKRSKSKKFNDFTSFGFCRRPHHYEEIKPPEVAHVQSQTEHFDNAVIESRVRSVLQAELGKLVPSICNRISQMNAANPQPPSTPSADFIREFFQIGNYSDEENRDNFHDIPDFLISFRHLQRLIQEETQAFAGDTYLVNVSKEFSDECMESIDSLHRCGSQSVVSFCSQNDKISSATDETSITPNGDSGNIRRDDGEEQVKVEQR